MSKLTALGMSIAVDNSAGTPVTITNDVESISSLNTNRALIDVSGLDVLGFERLMGRADSPISLAGAYNPAVSHTVFKDVGSQAGTVTRTVTIIFPGGGTATVEAIAASYNLAVGQDGAVTWTADLQSTGGTALAWT